MTTWLVTFHVDGETYYVPCSDPEVEREMVTDPWRIARSREELECEIEPYSITTALPFIPPIGMAITLTGCESPMLVAEIEWDALRPDQFVVYLTQFDDSPDFIISGRNLLEQGWSQEA